MACRPVNEIFVSLQGEGYHTGTPAVFVRFGGCNLRCDFCDTDHSSSELMSDEQIVQAVIELGKTPLVVLTGGEPTLTVDNDLVNAIKDATGAMVAIETNGTRPVPTAIDWIAFSPKEGLAGGDIQPAVLNRCDELKVVYVGQDLHRYDSIVATHRFLQPCYVADDDLRRRNMSETVRAVIANPGWRLSLQTHRVLNIR